MLSIIVLILGGMLGAYFTNNRLLFEKRLEIYSSFLDVLTKANSLTVDQKTPESIRQQVLCEALKVKLVTADFKATLLIDKLFEADHDGSSRAREQLIGHMRYDLMSLPHVIGIKKFVSYVKSLPTQYK